MTQVLLCRGEKRTHTVQISITSRSQEVLHLIKLSVPLLIDTDETCFPAEEQGSDCKENRVVTEGGWTVTW